MGTSTQGSTVSVLTTDLREKLLQNVERNASTTGILKVLIHRLRELQDQYVDADLKLKISHVAAWTGDVDTVRELKYLKADLNEKTEGGYTPLHLAASRGYSKVIEELQSWLGHQIDVQNDTSEDGFTSLHLAACSADPETVRLLLKNYADMDTAVNVKDKLFGRTALHFAIAGGHADVVQVLIESKVNLDFLSKDTARGWTPFLLSAWQRKGFHAVLNRRCSNFMNMLLEMQPGQINDQVGILARDFHNKDDQHLVNVEVVSKWMSKFFIHHTRLLLQKSKDGAFDRSVKSISVKDEKVNKNEWDQYQKFKVPMDWHSPLHLAATQNNPELVTYLLQCKDIRLNAADSFFGMTPLHCTIRTGAMEAFKVLIAVKEVDVCAKVLRGGTWQLPSWLSQNSSSNRKDDSELDFANSFQRFDTPLHLPIRVCKAEDLVQMLVEFNNHPNFDPATYNERRDVPLDIAWERYRYWAHKRSKLRRLEFHKENRYLDVVLDLLEKHPGNELIMTSLNDKRKAVQDSVNTFLVAATFIAGVTFGAYLQPPFDTDVGEFKSRPARLFWICNSLSFYCAVYTILRCLMCIMRSDQRSENAWEKTVLVALIRIQNGFPLTVSVGFGVGAFVAAGFGNLPPDSLDLMIACTISGVLLVVFHLLTNLYVFFSLMFDEFPDGNSRDSIFSVCWILGGPLSLAYLWLPDNVRKSEKLPKLLFNSDVSYNLVFLVLQVYGIVAVVTYCLIEIFLNRQIL